jgi:hypothetical protein
MQHLVRYTMPGGQHEHRDAASLEEATRLVEMAKNEFGATDAQIFREVPIEFKVQYKVTVADAPVPDAPPSDAPAVVPTATPAPPPAFQPDAAPPPPAMPPIAQPSEPPPGAMPLAARPVAPSTEETPDTEGDDESSAENVTPIGGEGTSRRTLFGRS